MKKNEEIWWQRGGGLGVWFVRDARYERINRLHLLPLCVIHNLAVDLSLDRDGSVVYMSAHMSPPAVYMTMIILAWVT
jgi:Rad3-related DNA helicase